MSSDSPFRRIRKHKLKAEINVVPFIDVMLVLLVIFMITVPVIHHSVKVDLPEDVQQKDKPKVRGDKSSEIVIQVLPKSKVENGLLYSVQTGQMEPKLFTQDEVGVLELTAYIALLRAGKSDDESAIVVFGDKTAEYGDVVGLFLRLKSENIKSVKLATQPAKLKVK
jgi:biopolymer transport protein TolR